MRVICCLCCRVFFCFLGRFWFVLLLFFLGIKTKIIKLSNRCMEFHSYSFFAFYNTGPFSFFVLGCIGTSTESSSKIVRSPGKSRCPMINPRRFHNLSRHWPHGSFISGYKFLIHMSKRLMFVQWFSL